MQVHFHNFLRYQLSENLNYFDKTLGKILRDSAQIIRKNWTAFLLRRVIDKRIAERKSLAKKNPKVGLTDLFKASAVGLRMLSFSKVFDKNESGAKIGIVKPRANTTI